MKCLAQASTASGLARSSPWKPRTAAPRQFLHQLRILGEAFVGAAPARILRHGDAGREGPLDAGGAHFLGGDALHLLHQRRIARAAEADVMREDHRAEDVVVPVHGVDAVEQRDLQARVPGVLLQAVVEVGPGLEAVAFLGVGTAAAENRAEE